MDDNPLETQTTRYGCRRTEFRDGGVMQVPVAAESGDTSIVPMPIVRLHPPRHFVVISFVAERWGGKPIVPSPEGLEPNAIFLEGWRSGDVPMLDETVKGHTWRCEGQYLYAKIQPPPLGLRDTLQVGHAPFDPTIGSPSQSEIPPDNFRNDLTGQGPQ